MSPALTRPFVAVGCGVAWLLAASSAHAAPLSVNQATRLLAQTVASDANYGVPGGSACLQFVLEASGKRYVEVAVREKSESPCQGGDTLQSPLLDRFRVSRTQGTIERQDEHGRFTPYLQPHRPRT